MPAKPNANTTCPRCTRGFTCGIFAGDDTCWCYYYPRMSPIPQEDTSTECRCLCPACLETSIMLGYDEDYADEER